MPRRKLILVILIPLIVSCVEPFKFEIKNEHPSLVIEASISDISYNKTLDYPSDGRYFRVRLKETQDVTNISDMAVKDAQVKLVDTDGQIWPYTESKDAPGDYYLLDKDFRAKLNKLYKLNIKLADGIEYESSWEEIHASNAKMGNISFKEIEKFEYQYVASEKVIETTYGINVNIEVPPNHSQKTTYYRWDYDPTWVYIAPLANNQTLDRICWAKNPYYIKDYNLDANFSGSGYLKNLIFLETYRNERIFTDFSLLITQFSMSEEYYYFWKEMKKQTENNGIFEAPPFNLKTNFTCLTNAQIEVSGYFGVVEEQAKRWYFNKDELSYNVENTLGPDCLVVYGPDGPAAACTHCLQYAHGQATMKAPAWWPYFYN